jgi:hypothetical protein
VRQAWLKRHLNELINRALTHVAETDRLALDTGDGAALCFFGDPENALFAAANLRQSIQDDSGPGAQVRIGINLGPSRVVRDLNGNRNVIGDGINVAQRVMGFTAPNQILVSRSFYEVVSRLSEESAQLFQYAGLHRDKHVRERELYEVHGGSAAGPAGDSVARAPAPAAARPTLFPPELLTRVTRALTAHLGPIAGVVVERAARQARDAEQFFTAAADSRSGPSRDRFLAEVSGAGAQARRPLPRLPVLPPPPGRARAPPAGAVADHAGRAGHGRDAPGRPRRAHRARAGRASCEGGGRHAGTLRPPGGPQSTIRPGGRPSCARWTSSRVSSPG